LYVGFPDQVPGDAVNTCPSCGEPVIVGAAVFTGAGCGTVLVAAEETVADPPAFDAVTATSIVSPMSLEATV
jgi:hypothetical protein